MLDKKTIIETERLILRNWNKNDLQFFIDINKDSQVMKYSTKILDATESLKYYSRIIQEIDYQGFGLYAVELKQSEQFIGYIGLTIPPYKFWPNFNPCVEIGWRLNANHWNKGYATEGAKACIEYGFKILCLSRIIAMTKTDNLASVRVMQKIGMNKDNTSIIDHLPQSYSVYEILN